MSESPRIDALIDGKPGLWSEWTNHDFHELQVLAKQLERDFDKVDLLLSEANQDKEAMSARIKQLEALAPRPEGREPVAWFIQNSEGNLHSLSPTREITERDAKILNQTVIPLCRCQPQEER